MRELSLVETKNTNGASAEAFIVATTLIGAGMIIAAANDPYYGSYYYDPYFYDPYPVTVDYYTPVYDSYGRYQGEVIDSYTYW